MSLFMQLKQSKDVDTLLVGTVAKQRAALQNVIAQQFALVLTSSLIARICEAATIQDLVSKRPTAQHEQIELFTQITTQLKQARPDLEVMNSLRESFELITLDTSDLQSLAQLPKQKSILGILPSPTYNYSEEQGQRMFVSGDTFDTYFEQLKVCIGSFFTPQAINYRLQQNIHEWNLACIVFRLPNIHTCLSVVRKGQESTVKTYVGLPDIRHQVLKDEFSISGTIPKITNRVIREQKEVCVYALDQNQIVAKQYISTTTSLQSTPDYDILEASRLARKIIEEWDEEEIHALFVKPKQGTLVLLDAYVQSKHLPKKQIIQDKEEKLLPYAHADEKQITYNKYQNLHEQITTHLPALHRKIEEHQHILDHLSAESVQPHIHAHLKTLKETMEESEQLLESIQDKIGHLLRE